MSEMVERVKLAVIEIIGEHYGDYDERIARAAIEAMREPTDAMEDAMDGVRDCSGYTSPRNAWHAAIDAALK